MHSPVLPLFALVAMVFFFETSCGHMIYMGKDKYENEDLIKYGLPEDGRIMSTIG